MTTKLAKTTAQFNRSGTVHYRVEHRENGEASLMLTVDFERAPEPDNSYVADYFEVHRTDADVLMVFGKTEFPANTSLRNKIEIYFPYQPFVHQFWRSARRMHKNLQETFQSKGRAPKAQGAAHEACAKVQTLAANNALVVISGGQCVMDFFLIAAKDLWIKTRKGDPLNVAAIVRVFMSEHILLGFLERCDVMAQQLLHEGEITVPEEDDENVESIELR